MNRPSLGLIIGFAAFFVTFPAQSEIVYSQVHRIYKIYAYDDYASNTSRSGTDVVVVFDGITGIDVCPNGGYISAGSDGYENLVTLAYSAFVAGFPVRLQLYNDKIWAGSSTELFCEIDAIRASSR